MTQGERPEVGWKSAGPRRTLVNGLTWLGLATPLLAGHDGVVSLAFPLEDITIDGDLADWPEGLPEYGAGNFLVAFPANEADLKVDFRVGYDELASTLLVAVRVEDDVHVPRSANGGPSGDPDGCVLFLDPIHAAEPGLPQWFKAELDGDGVTSLVAASSGAPKEGVQVAAKRTGTSTCYEWSVPIADFRPNRTLGLDVRVADYDGADSMSYAIWGPRGSKDGITGRLGDVVLMDPFAFPGVLQGAVRWEEGWGGRAPGRLVLTSKEWPELSLNVAVSEYGQYRVQAPPGEYEITPALGLTTPYDNGGGERRIASGLSVSAMVEPDQTSQAPDLLLTTLPPPRVEEKHAGLLHRLDEEHVALIEAAVRSWMDYYEVPGVSFSLVQDGKLAHHRTLGVRDRHTGEELDETMLFEAASITKPVFAFAVMRLVERGVLDLDRPLHEYLEFPNIAADERSRKITARLVLSHSSGLPNWAWGGPGGWRTGGALELLFEPGERFGYSGEGYNWLGRVVAHLTEKDLETLLQEEVAQVTGMTRVHFSDTPALAEAAARGHWHREVSYQDLPPEVSPASSMHTEAKDFGHFMEALLERRGLSAETYDTLLEPQRLTDDQGPTRDWNQQISLGLFLLDTPHGRMLGHGGNNGDFRCSFGVFPETGTGFAIYTNGNLGFRLITLFERLLLGVPEG